MGKRVFVKNWKYLVPLNSLDQRDIWKLMVCTKLRLAYARLVVLRALGQHRNNPWQLRRSDEQNDIVSFVNVGANNTANNMPTLAKRMTALWDTSIFSLSISTPISICGYFFLKCFKTTGILIYSIVHLHNHCHSYWLNNKYDN